MYTPHHFRPPSIAAVQQFVQEHAFATLVSQHKGLPIATHIPLQLIQRSNQWFLQGHVSKGNQQWKGLEQQEQVLAIFTEAHTYISSSWYDHVNVPTWNYISVHLYGKAHLLKEEELLKSLDLLVNHYEKGNEQPFHMNQMSPQLLKKELYTTRDKKVILENLFYPASVYPDKVKFRFYNYKIKPCRV